MTDIDIDGVSNSKIITEKSSSTKNVIHQCCENVDGSFFKFTDFFRFRYLSSVSRNILQFIFIAASSFILLMLFSVSTSPIYENTTYMFNDSNFFQVVGKIIAEGGTPYIDFFDHKGIYFFWYEALCYLIHPTFGFFILEWLIYSFSFFCLFKTLGTLKLSNFTCLVTSLLFIFCTCFIREGNTTEDFSLLFIAPALLIYIKAVQSDSKALFLLGNALCGLGAGILIFVRLTNAVPLFFLVCYYVVYAIKRRKFSDLFLNFIVCVIPLIITIIIPIVTATFGGYLTEMIEQTFLMNIEYSSQHFGFERFALMFVDIILAVLISYRLIKMRKERNDISEILLLLLISIIGNGIVFAYFSTYPHYYIVVFPVLLTSIALIVESSYQKDKKSSLPGIKHDNKSLLLICALTLISSCSTVGYFVYYCSGYYSFFSAGIEKSKAIEELIGDIYEESEIEGIEPDILTIDVNPGFWLYTDDVPECANFAFQSWQDETEENILPDLETYIIENTPDWIIIDDSDPFALNEISEENLLERNEIICNLENYGYSLYNDEPYFVNEKMEDVIVDDVVVVDQSRGLSAYKYNY